MVNDAENGTPIQNCVMRIVECENVPHLCLFATRGIENGEELRFDYGVTNLPWRKVSTLYSCIHNHEMKHIIDKNYIRFYIF